jgi:hypothetical protein
LDEEAEKLSSVAYKKLWNEILDEIENCDEELVGEPERMRFRAPDEYMR